MSCNVSRFELKDGSLFGDASFNTHNFSKGIGIESDGDSKSERPKPWSTRLAVGPNFSIPVGDFYSGITAGFGFGAELSIRLSRTIAIRGMVSRAGIRNDPVERYVNNTLVLDDSVDLTAWRYSVAVEYYTWPRQSQGGRILSSVYSGIGAVRHSASGYLFASNSDDYPAEPSDHITDPMILAGGDVTVVLSPHFGVNFGACMYLMAIGTAQTGSRYRNIAVASNFDLKVGLVLIH